MPSSPGADHDDTADVLGEIGELSSTAVDRVCALSPTMATAIGVGGHDGEWDDMGPAGAEAMDRLYRELLAEAQQCPVVGDDQELAREVLVGDLSEAVAGHEAGDQYWDLNNLGSTHQAIHDVIETTQGREAVEQRLATMGEALAGYRDRLAEGISRGKVVARRQVLAAIEQSQVWGTEGFTAQAADGMVAAVALARQAQREHAQWLGDKYLAHAAERDAVGPERYGRAAREYLGCDIDLAETYQWGWEELARLWDDMVRTCAQVAPGRGVAEAVAGMETDPSRSAADVGEYLEAMAQRQRQSLELLAGSEFDIDERLWTLDVKAAPPGGALAPYYMPPSEDLSRPGTVWYPIGDRERFPLWQEITTAHHEGVPGHHLQCGTQVLAGERLSRWHRTMSWKPGSGEGWALYAERLMDELGALEDPAWRAGMLSMQLLRAARVVVDIGLHLELAIPHNALGFHEGERWSAELAEEMLRDVAQLDEAMARSEVVRYLGLPAQAISYKLGEKRILELRDAASRQPGYDRKAFHATVLGVGAVGLDVLALRASG